MTDKVIYEKRGRTAHVTLNRPEARNAIDPDTSALLREAFDDFAQDDELWVAMLTGAEGTFSAGADLKAVAAGAKWKPGVPFAGITRDFECWKPIVAAIEGYCLAGGLELALCCDLRVAASDARFGLPETRWSMIPGAGGTQRLPRAVGSSRALELILLAEQVSAQDAQAMGLVQRVVAPGETLAAAEEWVDTLLQRGPLALRAAKRATLEGLDRPLEDGLALELRLADENRRTEDFKEGPRAFAEKRKPEFKGE
jgi:enoyl-CoA hydratase/carnithine racemase